ncbi:MAG TPA: hypothetical protein VM911_03385 [Pyrinomonadaceae bacterium]|jgi:hypothetical protein|nr:hypothetical protein [Pyrinomonadaceae bacterium]
MWASTFMGQKELHITIGTVPNAVKNSSYAGFDLNNDVSMVKAALLYANKAKLYSITLSMFLDGLSIRDFPIQKKVAFLESIADGNYNDALQIKELINQYRRAWKKRYSKRGMIELKALKAKIEVICSSMGEAFDIIAHDKAKDLLLAKESGLLEVHSFSDALLRTAQGIIDDEIGIAWIEEFTTVIGASVSDQSTYPLFDEILGRSIRLGIEAGVIPASDGGGKRAKEARLAAELFSRLPLFEEASIDEILDIRKELERPLVHFRSAVIGFSDNIKDAAWDENFSFDAEQVFNRDVAPAILNIEDEIKSNSYLKELARKWFDKSLLLTGGSALTLAVSNLPVPSLAALAVGVTYNTITAFYDTNKEWRAKQQAVERNNMYFYYKAGKMLSEKH